MKIRLMVFLMCVLVNACDNQPAVVGEYENQYGQTLALKKNQTYEYFDAHHTVHSGKWKLLESGKVRFYNWLYEGHKKGMREVTCQNATLLFSMDDDLLNFRRIHRE